MTWLEVNLNSLTRALRRGLLEGSPAPQHAFSARSPPPNARGAGPSPLPGSSLECCLTLGSAQTLRSMPEWGPGLLA